MSQYAVPPPAVGGVTSSAYVGASATVTSGVIKTSAGKLLSGADCYFDYQHQS